MNGRLLYAIDTADVSQILRHFHSCDQDFITSLTSRVELVDYACKIINCATRYEAWYDQDLVGLVAVYLNDKSITVFITSISVKSCFKRMGIGSNLLNMCLTDAAEKKIYKIQLEVEKKNTNAIAFYKTIGFNVCSINQNSTMMSLQLKD